MDATLLGPVLAAQYGLASVAIERFSPDHPTYLVRSDSGPSVARVGTRLERQVACLLALEATGHPAPRVVLTAAGRPLGSTDLEADARDVLLKSYVDGITPTTEPDHLYRLGVALGRLHHDGPSITHALPAVGHSLPVVDRALMLPPNELAFALDALLAVEERLPNRATAARWQSLVDACIEGQVDPPGLTHTFLHGDAHPWNSVLTTAGPAQFIDWDSAGPGPSISDLAFLVVSCATGGLIHPVTPADPRAVDGLLAGYRANAILSSQDADHLERAMMFRILVCAAVGFSHVIAAGKDPLQEPSVQWSLQRLQAVPRLADTVRPALLP